MTNTHAGAPRIRAELPSRAGWECRVGNVDERYLSYERAANVRRLRKIPSDDKRPMATSTIAPAGPTHVLGASVAGAAGARDPPACRRRAAHIRSDTITIAGSTVPVDFKALHLDGFKQQSRAHTTRRTMNDTHTDQEGTRELQPLQPGSGVPPTPSHDSRATVIGAAAFGALALGATAIAALAIGRLTIGVFAVKRGRVQSLGVDDLEVRRLHVMSSRLTAMCRVRFLTVEASQQRGVLTRFQCC